MIQIQKGKYSTRNGRVVVIESIAALGTVAYGYLTSPGDRDSKEAATWDVNGGRYQSGRLGVPHNFDLTEVIALDEPEIVANADGGTAGSETGGELHKHAR